MRYYIGLVHYPVYNKHCREIASALTTLDVHDLSRLAKTYGARGFFIVTPLEDQQRLAERLIGHWREGYGAGYNPDRREALKLALISPSIASSREDITKREGVRPLLIATDASVRKDNRITYPETSRRLRSGECVFLVFGTAWGLTEEALSESDYVLDPIEGCTGYNHLSVRAAAAIILDRLTGPFS